MIKIILCGALGRMGRIIIEEIDAENDLTLAGAVEASDHPGLGSTILGVDVTSDFRKALAGGDVVVDFTKPEAALSHILMCADSGKPIVVGTTGLSQQQLSEARKTAERIPLLISPNMSAGVNLLFDFLERIAPALRDFDVEIVESHHKRKKDSPSGTAARLADIIEKSRPGLRKTYGRDGIVGPRRTEELGMHSIRGGDIAGEHTVIFAGEGERFEITHKAHSRRTFARGTIQAVRFIASQKPGLYTMNDVLGLSKSGMGKGQV